MVLCAFFVLNTDGCGHALLMHIRKGKTMRFIKKHISRIRSPPVSAGNCQSVLKGDHNDPFI